MTFLHIYIIAMVVCYVEGISQYKKKTTDWFLSFFLAIVPFANVFYASVAICSLMAGLSHTSRQDRDKLLMILACALISSLVFFIDEQSFATFRIVGVYEI
jgi:uncharacterized membrane protein YozB (DUF420 family)